MAPLPASLKWYCRCGTGVVIPVALAHCLGGIALATLLLEVGPQGASQPLQAAAIPRMSRLAMPYLSPWSSYLCCLPARACLASRAFAALFLQCGPPWAGPTPAPASAASAADAPRRTLRRGPPFALLLTTNFFTPKSANPALFTAETFGGGAPMIFGATPPPSNVLAAIML
jgi:hypothetical protein